MSDSLQPHGLSPPGSSVHGVLQARILEWVAISFSRGSSSSRGPTHNSCSAGRLSLSHQGSPRVSFWKDMAFYICMPVRTGHGTTDWFQIGKGECQGCILSPCLFNLEKEMATHSSILTWRIPWTEEYGRLQSMGSQRIRHD